MKQPQSVTANIEIKKIYIMKLYIADGERNSHLARENLKDICEKYLEDRFQIQEIDVLTDFASALKDRIFFTPTLVLMEPKPRASVIGNLSDKGKVISTLRLRLECGK
jgi:circadian clock protein KaiB